MEDRVAPFSCAVSERKTGYYLENFVLIVWVSVIYFSFWRCLTESQVK